MNIKNIYVNLPVRDLKKTREFWTKMGFSFNETFSDDKAISLILREGAIYAMLITHEYFATFTNRPVADGSTTQVLNAIEVESREQVSSLMNIALENGATRYRDAQDYGWMFAEAFSDPDGNQWELLCIDAAKAPGSNTQ